MGDYKNIKEIINDCTEKYKDNIAFIIKNSDKKTYTNITFKRFGEEINALGTSLLNLGLKGKKIAIIGKNRYEWLVSYYAVANGLGVVVPLDKGLPDNEIESSLARSEADVFIFEEKYINAVNEILEKKTTKVSLGICMDKNSNFKSVPELIEEGKKQPKKRKEEYAKLEVDNEKSNIIIYTSGTTSLSKAVELSHKNIAANINSLRKYEKIYETDVEMAFLPFHHMFGSTGVLLFLSHGATTVFCDGLRYVAQNMKEYKVTSFFCVPLIIESMHKKIMHEIEKQGKMKKIKFAKKLSRFLLKFGIDIRRKLFKPILDSLGGNIRFVISGAAALDKQVEEDFNDFGILAIQGYGLTETSPVLAAENEYNMRYGSIGKPITDVEMKIDNPDENGVGEIIAKGDNVMKGYYQNEEATNEVLIDGWFHTGDLGYMDKDGFFYISGRKKNVIVLKNGKNVYPEELETLISNLPYVAENIVFGIQKDDDVMLSAKIVYNKEYIEAENENITEDEIKEKVWNDIKKINNTLCNYKHIKNIIVTDEPMIKTTTNKIKRFEEIKKYE